MSVTEFASIILTQTHGIIKLVIWNLWDWWARACSGTLWDRGVAAFQCEVHPTNPSGALSTLICMQEEGVRRVIQEIRVMDDEVRRAPR